MPLYEPVPVILQEKVGKEKIRLSAYTDIGADGTFGIRWLVVTDDCVQVYSPPPGWTPPVMGNGLDFAVEPPDVQCDIDLPLSCISDASTEMLVGCGRWWLSATARCWSWCASPTRELLSSPR
jgi:hypothetical protein